MEKVGCSALSTIFPSSSESFSGATEELVDDDLQRLSHIRIKKEGSPCVTRQQSHQRTDLTVARQPLLPRWVSPWRMVAANGRDTIRAPYPWATNLRAQLKTEVDILHQKHSPLIYGEFRCRQCRLRIRAFYNLETKFQEVLNFIVEKKLSDDGEEEDPTKVKKAPKQWLNPQPGTCQRCGAQSLVPVIASKKQEINWLFLGLGQYIGLCEKRQLKYFLKHNLIRYSDLSRAQLILLCYFGICKQLDPNLSLGNRLPPTFRTVKEEL